MTTSYCGGTGGVDDNAAQAGYVVAQCVVQPLAVRGRDGGSQIEVGPDNGPYNALRAGDGGSSQQSLIAVTYAPDKAATLTSGAATSPGVNPPGRRQEDDKNIVAFDWQTSGSERSRPNISDKRTSAIGTTNRDAVFADTIVRRLTETEYERLQGYPDGWTKGQSGSARYRQLGNSVAVPVVEWIARRIAQVDGEIRA